MAETLQAFSSQLADTVAGASSSIVRVEARRRIPATGIIWNGEGLILTASHVVRREEKIKVGLADGSELRARLVGRDHTTDLALLQVEASGLASLELSHSDNLAVGHLAFALGRPGKTVQATLGIISALGTAWRTRAGGTIDRFLQTDVVMYPGFSGGPLIGAGGTLLGLNSSALYPGVSVAVPTETLSRVAESLQAHGRIQRGYLGVSTQRVRLPKEVSAAREQTRGLLIVDVESDSPAEQSGLLLGDVIVGFDGKNIEQHDDLLAQLGGDRVGKKIPAIVIRGGQEQTLNVRVGERP